MSTSTDPGSDTAPKSKKPFSYSNNMNLGQLVQGGGVVSVLGYGLWLLMGRTEKLEMRSGAQQEIIARIEITTASLAQSQQQIALTLAALAAKVEERARVP